MQQTHTTDQPQPDASSARPAATAGNAAAARLRRALPGLLAALLFGALALRAPAPLAVLLGLGCAGAIVAQPGVLQALRRLAAWPGLAHAAAVAAVLALGAGLRFWGLGFGLPYRDHPDEWAVADRAVAMLQTGDYNPGSFIYPTLYTSMQLGVAALHFLWGASAGVYRAVAEIDPARFYLWGRALTALLGTGALALTYALGRRLYGRTAGLSAAALLAVLPAAVGDAHYITTDTPSMFFTALAFLPIAGLALPGAGAGSSWRRAVALALLAGLGVGLAAATKYNAAVLVIPLAYALALAAREAAGEAGRTLPAAAGRLLFFGLCALLGILLGFTLGTPLWLRELPRLLDDIASVLVHYKYTGHPGAESSQPALFYWQTFVDNGVLVGPAFLAGALLAFLRRSRADLLLLAFAAPYFLQMSGLKVVFVRNTMPLLPFLCLMAGGALAALVAYGENREPAGVVGAPVAANSKLKTQNSKLKLALLALLLLLVITPPLWQSARDNWLRAQPTTRVLATEWVEREAADGARIWLEDQTLILPPRLRVQGGEPVTSHLPEWYRENGFRFLVVNRSARRDDAGALAAFGAPAAEFTPDGQRHGPRFSVYDTGLGDLAAEPRSPSGATLGAGALALDGYRHPAEARPGETLPLALYWRVNRALPQDYVVFVHLLDVSGGKAAQRDTPPLDGSLPTGRWQPGALIRDDQDLALPPDLPPGTYTLAVGMYDPQTVVSINDAGPIRLGELVVR